MSVRHIPDDAVVTESELQDLASAVARNHHDEGTLPHGNMRDSGSLSHAELDRQLKALTANLAGRRSAWGLWQGDNETTAIGAVPAVVTQSLPNTNRVWQVPDPNICRLACWIDIERDRQDGRTDEFSIVQNVSVTPYIKPNTHLYNGWVDAIMQARIRGDYLWVWEHIMTPTVVDPRPEGFFFSLLCPGRNNMETKTNSSYTDGLCYARMANLETGLEVANVDDGDIAQATLVNDPEYFKAWANAHLCLQWRVDGV